MSSTAYAVEDPTAKDAQVATSVLVNWQIKEALRRRTLVMYPQPAEEAYDTNAVEVRLANRLRLAPFGLWHTIRRMLGLVKPLDPRDKSAVAKLIQSYPMVELGENGYILQPGQLVIGETEERIWLPSKRIEEMKGLPLLCAEIDGLSSLGRVGLEIHVTAGKIKNGTKHRITLEILNASKVPILLSWKMFIAQLQFLTLAGDPTAVKPGFARMFAAFDEENEDWTLAA